MSHHTLGEGLLTAASVGLLFMALIAIDWRTREKVTSIVHDGSFSTLRSGAAWLEGAGSATLDAIRYQSLEHAPLTVFFVVAAVLLLFMVKT
jgi:hypothetical protein